MTQSPSQVTMLSPALATSHFTPNGSPKTVKYRDGLTFLVSLVKRRQLDAFSVGVQRWEDKVSQEEEGPLRRRRLWAWTLCSARFPDRVSSAPEEQQQKVQHLGGAGSAKLPSLWLHASARVLKFGKADAHPVSGKKTGEDNCTKSPIFFIATVMSPEKSMIWKETARKDRLVDTAREGQGGTTWEHHGNRRYQT